MKKLIAIGLLLLATSAWAGQTLVDKPVMAFERDFVVNADTAAYMIKDVSGVTDLDSAATFYYMWLGRGTGNGIGFKFYADSTASGNMMDSLKVIAAPIVVTAANEDTLGGNLGEIAWNLAITLSSVKDDASCDGTWTPDVGWNFLYHATWWKEIGVDGMVVQLIPYDLTADTLRVKKARIVNIEIQ